MWILFFLQEAVFFSNRKWMCVCEQQSPLLCVSVSVYVSLSLWQWISVSNHRVCLWLHLEVLLCSCAQKEDVCVCVCWYCSLLWDEEFIRNGCGDIWSVLNADLRWCCVDVGRVRVCLQWLRRCTPFCVSVETAHSWLKKKTFWIE